MMMTYHLKKSLTLIAATLIAFTLLACGRAEQIAADEPPIASHETPTSLQAAGLNSSKASPQRPIRIAVAYFSHEATTFSQETAGIGDFEPISFKGNSLYAADESLQGFVDAIADYTDVELIPLESFGNVIGGSSVGHITTEAYEHYTNIILRDLKAAGAVDAVFLALHGAAAVENIERPEADLAKKIRGLVGSQVPIAATFDPHGNEDEHFLQFADFSLAMKYFPHYDGRLQGERAAKLLLQAISGRYKPTTATKKPGIITPTVLQWTGIDPWASIVQRALTWEAREKDVYISVFFGFPWNDSVDAGLTVQVMTNDDQKLADKIADDMSAFMHRKRHEMFQTEIIPPASAVAQAVKAVKNKKTPVVLADYSDRNGDATHILKQIIDQGLSNVIYGAIRDERVLDALDESNAQIGDAFEYDVGGFVRKPASGSPIKIKGVLKHRTTVTLPGYKIRVAAVEFGSNNILFITDQLVQILEPNLLRTPTINPDNYDVFVVKSRVHFRRGFDDTGYAKTIMIVDAPGPYLGTVHLDALNYQNIDLNKFYPFNEKAQNTEPKIEKAN